MQAKRSRSSRRRPKVRVRQRRWQVPPPITRERGGRLPAISILEEFPGETGVLLWQSLRSVLSWEKAKKGQRKRLFLPDAAGQRHAQLQSVSLPAELEEPVGILAGVLDASTTAKKLAVACREISDWAFGLEHTGTAFHFMQAAALGAKDDARLAYETGRLARRRAEYEVAVSWFDEAASRALEKRDWDTYGRVFIGMGNLHLQRGNYPAAKDSHSRAFSIATKHDLPELQGMASHDLFLIAMTKGEESEAESLAARTLHLYGARHPRLPNLTQDLALFRAENGHHASARSLLAAVLPHIERRRDRLLALGVLADSSAALGDVAGFEAAWERIWAIVEEGGGSVEGSASALASLAESALRLRDWERTVEAAKRALAMAEQRQEHAVNFRATAALDAAASGIETAVSTLLVATGPAFLDRDRITDEFVAALALSEA